LQSIKQSKFFLLLVFIFLLAASLACNLSILSGNSLGKRDSTAAHKTSAGEGLRCERMAYPCSYADADPERVSRSLKVMDLADEVYAGGGNAVEVAQRLQQESDVVELYYDERGVWYRVEGAPPMVFIHPDLFPQQLKSPDLSESSRRAAKAALKPVHPDPDGPVGRQNEGEKARKKMLMVSPYAWSAGTEIIDAVEPLMREYRDYRCPSCVRVMANHTNPKSQLSEENPAAGPSVEQFLNWEEFDIINIVAHGFQFCPGKSVSPDGRPVVKGNRESYPENTKAIVEGSNVSKGSCVTMVGTGHYRLRDHVAENPSSTPGVIWMHAPDGKVWWESVSTDFFQTNYPGGLDDKIIYFTSCQVLRDDSLASALIGSNTAVISWTDFVFINVRGEPVAIKFYQELMKYGLRVSRAFEKTVESSAHTNHVDEWLGAELVMKKDGDPRGREVVTAVHPATRFELLEEGTTVTQGVIQDGEKDQLYFAARVDGVDADQSLDDFKVHLILDDEKKQHTFTPDPTQQVGEYSYLAQGTIQLPYDITNQETMQLETWAELPEGGETRHVLKEVQPVGCGWRGTLSGTVSGDYKGLIMDYKDLANSIESGQVQDLMDITGGGSALSGLGKVGAALGKVWILTFDRSDKFVGMLAPDMGMGTLPTLDSDLLGYETQNLTYQRERTGDFSLTGTFSGPYRGLKLEGTRVTRTEGPSFQGEFVYHDGALCNMDVMAAIMEYYVIDSPFGP